MSTLTIHITLDEKESVKLTFAPQEFNWESLVDAIIKSTSSACIDLPIILYYRKGLTILSLENQEQLSKLPTTSTLELYSQKELVKESAFVRLGKLVEVHKQVISSSGHISRCIGIMASAIALDTNNKDFDNEFNALEKLISSRNEHGPTDTSQSTCDKSRHERGFGRGFGGRGHHHHGYSGDFSGKRHHKSCFRGDSSAEEMDVLKTQLSNTHIDKHEKGFKKRHGGPHIFGHHF